MPTLKINNVDYHYEETGSGAETIVFAHGFLWSNRMFDKQVEALKSAYRIITYDHRGQGQTEVTADGYDMDTLTDDAVALIKALNVHPCHFVGLSMGGFIAMRLASRHAHLLKSITLIETTADPETIINRLTYRITGYLSRYMSDDLVVRSAMNAMFGKTFLNDANRAEERAYWRQQVLNNDEIGVHRALMGVLSRQGVYDELANITIPTLIIVGDEDTTTVPAEAERIQQAIPHSHLITIQNAGHTSTVEQPDQVIEAMRNFLNNLSSA